MEKSDGTVVHRQWRRIDGIAVRGGVDPDYRMILAGDAAVAEVNRETHEGELKDDGPRLYRCEDDRRGGSYARGY